jgi:hypothetical protein
VDPAGTTIPPTSCKWGILPGAFSAADDGGDTKDRASDHTPTNYWRRHKQKSSQAPLAHSLSCSARQGPYFWLIRQKSTLMHSSFYQQATDDRWCRLIRIDVPANNSCAISRVVFFLRKSSRVVGYSTKETKCSRG